MSAAEDVFADHFPGHPILPGALVVEAFSQAAQLLVGLSSDFANVGRPIRIVRGAFRHFVRPGDQLRIRCERRAGDEVWLVAATADVGARRVATATLELRLEPVPPGSPAGAEAARLRALAEEARSAPLDLGPSGGPA